MSELADPVRVQLSRRKGFRLPPNTISVARPGRWGNPYVGDGDHDRAYMAQLFADYCSRPEQAAFVAAVRRELRGMRLACWCPLDQPCHADVLLGIANS